MTVLSEMQKIVAEENKDRLQCQCGARPGDHHAVNCAARPQIPDIVNHPDHYKVGGIETIDFIEAKLSPEEFTGYCLGNALKYISRAGHKTSDGNTDLRKAIWYLNRVASK